MHLFCGVWNAQTPWIHLWQFKNNNDDNNNKNNNFTATQRTRDIIIIQLL